MGFIFILIETFTSKLFFSIIFTDHFLSNS
jgi:hypothetical protein